MIGLRSSTDRFFTDFCKFLRGQGLGAEYNRNLLFRNNVVHDHIIGIYHQLQSEASNITFENNTFHNDQYVSVNSNKFLVRFQGNDFSPFNFLNNRYYTLGQSSDSSHWFSVNNELQTLSEWQSSFFSRNGFSINL